MIPVFQAPESHWTKVSQNIYSQYGEDGILREIFRMIGTNNRQCFEVGAADGKWFSNTRRLVDEGWRACLIEADPANWPALDKLDRPNIDIVHGKAEPAGDNSLDSILAKCKYEQFPDLGIIDVDGQDYYLWNGMLRIHPRVMVVEYDGTADPNFIPDLNGQGQAGLAAICSIATTKGYFNVATTPTNAIFLSLTEKDKFAAAVEALSIPKPLPVPVENVQLPANTAVLATGKEEEIKIAALLSRPRFGLNCFWDMASEALSPWGIPIQSFYGVFWGQCMQTALEENVANGIDWILTLDYDSAFTSKHVQQLIDVLGTNPQIDAVCGLQVRRGRPLPLAVRADGQMRLTGGPVQATTAHFGLTLFRAESFKKMKKPWFWAKPTEAGTWGEGRLDDDIYFWGQWRDAGNTLFVHTGCKIGHVEEMVAEFDEKGEVNHAYISEWRKRHGHQIKSFE
jgi:hypothetical protein